MIENEFARHIKYCKHHDIDPTVPSKREILIQEVYDAPLDRTENRGKHGKYIDFVKPLLVKKGSFQGTINQLLPKLGLFEPNNTYWRARKNKWELSFWENGTSENVLPGRIYYDRRLLHNSKQAITRGLDALNGDGIITLRRYYCFLPSSEHFIPDSISVMGIEISIQEMFKTINEDENAAITSKEFKALRQEIESNKRGTIEGIPVPSFLPESDNHLIERLIAFMRQYTYKICNNMQTIPALDQLPNEYNFWGNRQLHQVHQALIQKCYPFLIGCKTIWKELAYHLTELGKNNQAQYLGELDTSTVAKKLSCLFLGLTGAQMEKILIPCRGRDELKDFTAPYNKPMRGNKTPPVSITRWIPLRNNISAYNRHKELYALYGIVLPS